MKLFDKSNEQSQACLSFAMKKNGWTGFKTNIVRHILAFCFFLSGGTKAGSLRAFEQEIQQYGETYIGEWVSNYSTVIAMTICIIEISVAFLALFKRFERFSAIMFFSLLLFFVYLTGMNYLFPTVMGSIESCGCFGELVHFTPVGAFAKSIFIWIISCINLYTAFLYSRKL